MKMTYVWKKTRVWPVGPQVLFGVRRRAVASFTEISTWTNGPSGQSPSHDGLFFWVEVCSAASQLHLVQHRTHYHRHHHRYRLFSGCVRTLVCTHRLRHNGFVFRWVETVGTNFMCYLCCTCTQVIQLSLYRCSGNNSDHRVENKIQARDEQTWQRAERKGCWLPSELWNGEAKLFGHVICYVSPADPDRNWIFGGWVPESVQFWPGRLKIWDVRGGGRIYWEEGALWGPGPWVFQNSARYLQLSRILRCRWSITLRRILRWDDTDKRSWITRRRSSWATLPSCCSAPCRMSSSTSASQPERFSVLGKASYDCSLSQKHTACQGLFYFRSFKSKSCSSGTWLKTKDWRVATLYCLRPTSCSCTHRSTGWEPTTGMPFFVWIETRIKRGTTWHLQLSHHVHIVFQNDSAGFHWHGKHVRFAVRETGSQGQSHCSELECVQRNDWVQQRVLPLRTRVSSQNMVFPA